jgi:hypothetical protein
MLVSFVLRLTPAALATGTLAGEVEHVRTGARAQFRDADELSTWCRRVSAVPAPRCTPSTSRHTTSSES